MGSPLLLTDGYKFSMAEAGWPLRRETFYYSHRKGGLQVLPFDVEAELAKVLPELRAGDWEFLALHDYDMGSAVKAALVSKQLTVRALPKHAVFSDREPVFSVSACVPLVSKWVWCLRAAAWKSAASITDGTSACESPPSSVWYGQMVSTYLPVDSSFLQYSSDSRGCESAVHFPERTSS